MRGRMSRLLCLCSATFGRQLCVVFGLQFVLAGAGYLISGRDGAIQGLGVYMVISLAIPAVFCMYVLWVASHADE